MLKESRRVFVLINIMVNLISCQNLLRKEIKTKENILKINNRLEGINYLRKEQMEKISKLTDNMIYNTKKLPKIINKIILDFLNLKLITNEIDLQLSFEIGCFYFCIYNKYLDVVKENFLIDYKDYKIDITMLLSKEYREAIQECSKKYEIVITKNKGESVSLLDSKIRFLKTNLEKIKRELLTIPGIIIKIND